ncbi:MAG: hypothetical protein HEQ16_17125 [Bosea sp.]|jgi:hypothetical protein|nr:hypothetical protein [Bosea sp. (in: a-proteobacteria)]
MTRKSMPSPERTLLLALYDSHLQGVRALQTIILDEMARTGAEIPLALGEMLEDLANRYLDAAELISERHQAARREEPPSPPETMSECRAEG